MKKQFSEMIVGDLEIAAALVGWTILEVGETLFYQDGEYQGCVEGGLTVILQWGNEKKKLIFGYTELGMWIEHEGVL